MGETHPERRTGEDSETLEGSTVKVDVNINKVEKNRDQTKGLIGDTRRTVPTSDKKSRDL